MGCDFIVGCVDKLSVRRDLEAFSRRHLIPYLDIGMDVKQLPNGVPEIYGQVILSMPGYPCMRCMGFLKESELAQEAQIYGDAGSKPQVIWSNGVLASTAVGLLVDLLTDWSKKTKGSFYHVFRGSQLLLGPDKRTSMFQEIKCSHFPLQQAGDVQFRKL
jgi:hypothetical protein